LSVIEEAEKIPTMGMSTDESKWLYETAQKMNSIIEIGSWMGKSTYLFCSGCKGNVYAIDHFKGSEEIPEVPSNLFEIFMGNIGHFTNLRVLAMTSEEAWGYDNIIPLSVDMIFIDGAHDYNSVLFDLQAWAPRVKKLISGHDRDQAGVPKALKEFFKPDQVKPGAGSIWYVEVGDETIT
jgi:predicted O-methyltransferase YrrM